MGQPDKEILGTLSGHYACVTSLVSFYDDESKQNLLVSTSQDHTVKVWNTSSLEMIRSLQWSKDIVLKCSVIFNITFTKKELYIGTECGTTLKIWTFGKN